MADLTGKILQGRYKIEALVGRGGMAEVYRAHDTHRGYPVAIKVLHENLAEDRELLRRFQVEAATLSQLNHANIVRFYSFEREGYLAFLVMDFIQGVTLSRRLLAFDGPMPLNEALSILEQVGRALQYAHTEGILHRDIKPGNIMLTPDGRALLSDFGIAKMLDSATMTAIQPGTPPYMAPEQWLGRNISVQTDIYGLGVMAYEMLTGRRPFRGDTRGDPNLTTREALQAEHLHQPPPPPERFNPNLPAHISAALLKALAKDPAERFGSVTEFVAALRAAPAGAALQPPVQAAPAQVAPPRPPAPARAAQPPGPPPYQPPAPQAAPAGRPAYKRRQTLVVTMLVAVLILASGVGYALLHQPAPAAEVIPTQALNTRVPTRLPASATPPAEIIPPPPGDTPVPPSKTLLPSKTPTHVPAATHTPSRTPTKTATPVVVMLPIFTANVDVFCRDAPGPDSMDRTTLAPGESEEVLARWSNDWLLLSVERDNTRTKCCWVNSAYGTLNVPLSSIRLITVIPDRMTCILPPP